MTDFETCKTNGLWKGASERMAEKHPNFNEPSSQRKVLNLGPQQSFEKLCKRTEQTSLFKTITYLTKEGKKEGNPLFPSQPNRGSMVGLGKTELSD